MLEVLRHRLAAYPTLRCSPNMRSERRRCSMTKRQMAFGVICFLVGLLVGIEIAGNLDALVRLVIIVAILLLCVTLTAISSRSAKPPLPRPEQVSVNKIGS
jgi:hypothetical protein